MEKNVDGIDSKVKLVSVPRKDISIENIPELFDPDEHSKVERDYDDDDDGILKTGIRDDEYLYRNDHNYMQKRFTAAEELVIKVIEQQYKMASDTKTQNYGTIVRTDFRTLLVA